MTLPRLHAVTSDALLAEGRFEERARALIEEFGPTLALHLRGHRTAVRRIHEVAVTLVEPSGAAGTVLLVNDRTDVALAVGCGGVQLGRRSIPVQAVRALVGAGCRIGYSAHGADEAESAVAGGADFVFVGTIWSTASHPGEPGAGVGRIRETADRLSVPVIAIGGVTPERTREASAAGAWGVAVQSGVWSADDPAAAVRAYLKELQEVGA